MSPWHDLALKLEGSDLDIVQGLIEITRGTTAKMEVATTKPFNPIVQDLKKCPQGSGRLVLRNYGIETYFNYGCLPQTWENCFLQDQSTGCMGDNDPLDLVDLTPRQMPLFERPRLKVLGALCLIDQDELDWKVLAIEESFSQEHGIRSLEDYDQYNPGVSAEVREWFRSYKTYDGKPENKFGHDERILSLDETLEIITENHEQYVQLVNGQAQNPNEELWFYQGY